MFRPVESEGPPSSLTRSIRRERREFLRAIDVDVLRPSGLWRGATGFLSGTGLAAIGFFGGSMPNQSSTTCPVHTGGYLIVEGGEEMVNNLSASLRLPAFLLGCTEVHIVGVHLMQVSQLLKCELYGCLAHVS